MDEIWTYYSIHVVILSIVNVAFSSKITIHVDDEGKVTETAPTCKFKTGWTFVEQDAAFSVITDAGVLGSFQIWLKMQGVEFEHLSRSDVEQGAESGEVDIWANGLGHHINKHSVLTEDKKGLINSLKTAVESHVADRLMALVFDGKKPNKVKFGIARRDYFISFDGPVHGIDFRIILKKADGQ
ncbi:hypothetical protein DdX_15438 [Ditylenchus destructor]|uniref:Uncharacterized protein n=1 Tax=Ditylenchus destructor TaxID=166010 RepID=A0AAD4R0U6_9BILA|nr:hypothetical protein DdX_15438 [Ditylenchus destructor]